MDAWLENGKFDLRNLTNAHLCDSALKIFV
jgi:hypothetical protein